MLRALGTPSASRAHGGDFVMSGSGNPFYFSSMRRLTLAGTDTPDGARAARSAVPSASQARTPSPQVPQGPPQASSPRPSPSHDGTHTTPSCASLASVGSPAPTGCGGASAGSPASTGGAGTPAGSPETSGDGGSSAGSLAPTGEAGTSPRGPRRSGRLPAPTPAEPESSGHLDRVSSCHPDPFDESPCGAASIRLTSRRAPSPGPSPWGSPAQAAARVARVTANVGHPPKSAARSVMPGATRGRRPWRLLGGSAVGEQRVRGGRVDDAVEPSAPSAMRAASSTRLHARPWSNAARAGSRQAAAARAAASTSAPPRPGGWVSAESTAR